MEEAEKQKNIDEARKAFEFIKEWKLDLDVALSLIDKPLERAGVGYEALDPEGKKSADEMKAIIDFHLTEDKEVSGSTIPKVPAKEQQHQL